MSKGDVREIAVKMRGNVPMTPNFVITSTGKIPIHELTDEAIRELGKAWTDELLAKAARRRATKEVPRTSES